MNEGEQKVRHEHEMSRQKNSYKLYLRMDLLNHSVIYFICRKRRPFLITVTSVTQFFVLKSKKFFGISGHLLLLLFRDFLKGR